MKCVIIANGHLEPNSYFKNMIRKADLIVCADGGARHLKTIGILPDVLIGDFDSLPTQDKAYFHAKQIPIIPFDIKKDNTDTDLAISWALDNGASDITLIGVTGTRLDHTLCNILMLKKLVEQDIPCRIIDANNEIYLVMERLVIDGKPGEILSILPVSAKVTGITLEGLEYKLEDAVLKMGASLGCSNVFIENKAVVSIKSGILAVLKSKD